MKVRSVHRALRLAILPATFPEALPAQADALVAMGEAAELSFRHRDRRIHACYGRRATAGSAELTRGWVTCDISGTARSLSMRLGYVPVAHVGRLQ